MIDLKPHRESGNGENWMLGQELTIQLNHSYHTVSHSNNIVKWAKGRLASFNTLRWVLSLLQKSYLVVGVVTVLAI